MKLLVVIVIIVGLILFSLWPFAEVYTGTKIGNLLNNLTCIGISIMAVTAILIVLIITLNIII